jgi:hypothetical protein
MLVLSSEYDPFHVQNLKKKKNMLLINQYIEISILTQKMFILTTHTCSVANYDRWSDSFNFTDNLKPQSPSDVKKIVSLEIIYFIGI